VSAFSRSYARATLESVPAGYNVEKLIEDLRSVARAVDGSSRLREFFSAPKIPREPKQKALEAIAGRVGVDDFGRRLLGLVLLHGRLRNLSEIVTALSDSYDKTRGHNEAHVTVATALTPEQERRIADALGRSYGGTFRLNVRVDETILGGFVARVRSQLIDASVASAIARFRKQGEETARA
jgi:F-type H+-transporting ATPase subunit delta